MEGDFFQGGGLALILSLCEGRGVEINFCLIRGEYDLVLGRISPISQSPLPPGNYCTVPKYFGWGKWGGENEKSISMHAPRCRDTA